MADVQSNIHVNIDTSGALASLKALQRQISAFHTQMAKSGTAAAAVSANQAQNLMNSINATGKFQASMRTVTTSTEHFTTALEKNKLSSREYFRYTGAATKTFGRLFKSEFDTINKVARERVKDVQTQYIKMGRGANGALQAIAVRPLTLDMKNLGTQTAIAAQRQQMLNQLLKQGSTNLLNFGKNTQWAGRQLMVGFTVPLVMLGSAASKTFMQIEEQAIRFKRVYGELFTTSEETDAMVKDIQLLAKEYTKYGVAVESTMKMAADAAAQGKMGADLLAQVSEATRLAVLGGVEQEEALLTTISVTNAFGVATEDLAKKIDFLNAVENQTVVSIEDLTIAIPKAGPVVQQLGGDVEDLAFFLTAMKEGGINASEGANALKSGLASLINPSEKASKMLMGLGVNIKGIVEANAGDVKSTVVDFANALDTLDPLNRARAIEQLFGKFQFSRLSTLFQNVVAEGTQASRVLKLASATTEELAILSERELGKIENTTTYKFKKSIEDLKVSIAPVGEAFLKALTPIVEFAAKVLDKFNNLGDGTKKFLTIMTVLLGAVGPVALMAFGLLANGVANIIKLFANMKSAFNRAGSSTQILGQQTDYLTQQQLEASAVAASLNQVHTKLQQTFTSEASAVNALALSYRNAIAAQVGFTGPVRGSAKSQGAKKYSTGTTRVPGTGNQDTVPAVLTPGEAVIPADVAQDPKFKPIISAMVNRRLQGFKYGTENVTSQGEKATSRTSGPGNTNIEPRLEFAHATKKDIINLNDVPDDFKKDAQELKVRGFKEANAYSGLGFDIPKPLHDNLKINQASLDEYLDEIKKPRAIQTMTENLMKKNPNLTASEAARTTDKIRRELISSLETLPRVPGNKPTFIGDDLVASRIGDLKSGIVGSLVLDKKHADSVKRVFSAAGIGGYGAIKAGYDSKPATPRELLKAVEATGQKSIATAVQRLVDHHPDTPVQVRRDSNGNIIAYNRPEVGRTPPHAIKKTTSSGELGPDGKFIAGRSDGSSGSVKIAGTASKPIRQAVARALFGLTDAELKGKNITTYAQQISQGTGFSNVAAKHLSGIHETLDGKKVFVKPMVDLRSALAEQRATQIARDVHGLDAPNQQLRIIQDPNTGKTMYALESAFDDKFDPKNMKGTFTQDEYIRQNVAAALRADKDLGRGNLSGNILADVGTAGVFEKASGERKFAQNLLSMEEQAIKNLDTNIPDQNRKKFFADATADIARSMTPKQYHDAMIAEIDRVLPKLKETVKSFNLKGEERKVYNSMIKRLEAGRKVDWTKLHERHISIKDKVAIKPGEMIEDDKTKKLTKPKTQKLPANVVSAAGKEDTLMTDKPKKGSRIVNTPSSVKRGPRGVIIPGQADAQMASGSINITDKQVAMPGGVRRLADTPSQVITGVKKTAAKARAAGREIGTSISQSAAAASRTALYGTGPIDADAKSLRRQLQARKAKTQAQTKASNKTLYGSNPIDATAKSIRRNSQLEVRRSQIAQRVALKESILAEKIEKERRERPLRQKIAESKVSQRAQGFVQNTSARLNSSRVGQKIQSATEKSNQKKQERIAAGRGPGMGMAGGAMALSGVAMMASMVPGTVGEMAQKIMMPLMGIAMILPMLQNKFSALAVGVGLLVAAYAYQKMAFDKAQNAALELTEAMNGGTKSTKNFAEFAGNVTAGEVMRRRRQDSFSPFQIQTGKSTFGESFVAGEQGKAMAKNVASTFKSGGKGLAQDQVVNQMATAVASGALSVDQARSVVANLGKELGDYGFSIQVNAKLIELLGPDGENLTKDPLGIRVKILQDTREKMNFSADAARNAGGFTLGDAGKNAKYGSIGTIGGGVAGLGVGLGAAAAATAAGATIGSAVPVVGTIIGAAIGLGVGTFLAKKDRNKRIGETSGANVAMQKIALEQQQEMLDSLDLQYQKEVEIAKAAGNTTKVKELTDAYEINRVGLLEENATLVGDIQKNFADSEGATRKALMTGADKAITNQYKDGPLADVAPLAKTLIDGSGISEDMQYTLKMQLASEQIDPMQMMEIFNTFGDDKAAMENVVTIIGEFGGAFANQVMGIVGMFEDKQQATTFVANIKTKTPAKAQEHLELFQKIAQSNAVIGADVALNYYNSKPAEAEKLQTSLDAIEALDSKKKITPTVAATVLGSEEMELLKADQEYFDSLPAVQQKTYLQNLKVMMGMEGDPAMMKQYDNWVNEEGGKNKGKTFADFVTFRTNQVTDASATDTTKPGGNVTPPAAAKIQSSPLDDLLKKLRDVRDNNIKVTEGFNASSKALNKLLGGKKDIKIFSGIENDIRKLGGGEDLIEMIVGMDPKEYEKHKKKLFEFDAKGNISKLKGTAKSINKALMEIKLGEFVSEQGKMFKQMGNQTTALNRLQAAGVEGSVALEAVADASFAAAVANKNLTDKELKTLVKTWNQTTKAAEKYAAVTSAISATSALQDRAKTLTTLTKDMVSRTQQEQEAILGSVELQNLIKTGQGNSEQFKKLLQAELDKANVELKIKAMSIGGMEEIFSQGFSKAMESFDVQEKALQLKFNIDNKSLIKEIENAENEIALISFKIDDKEAALKYIADEEEKINEKYDERLEALNEIEKANASVSAQQRGQLSLAEALTSGDIAAAARAAQEMRSQQAAEAATKQKEALEKSREFELGNIRSKDGKTRKELEKEIKDLQDKIFEIEEKTLEPRRETLRLNELQLKNDIEQITVLGKTREQWEGINNLVDLARTNSAKFIKSMQDALDVYQKLISAYKNEGVDTAPLAPPIESASTPATTSSAAFVAATSTATNAATTAATTAATAASTAAADAYAKAKAAGNMDAAAKAAAGVGPSALAAGESGAIGAASIAAQLKAAEQRLKASSPPALTSAQIIANRRAQYGYLADGGMVPKYFAVGGFAKGTDTVPAMLTPGEFVMSKYAVDSHGIDNMKKINSGDPISGTVYNNTYTLTVNAKTDANPNDIAQAVMSTIKRVDDRRIRGVSLNGR